MKTFRILPWYFLLLIVVLCAAAFVYVKEGYTNDGKVKTVTQEDLEHPQKLTTELLAKPSGAVIVIAPTTEELQMDAVKKIYPRAEFYLFPPFKEQVVGYIRMLLCYEVDITKTPLILKKRRYTKISPPTVGPYSQLLKPLPTADYRIDPTQLPTQRVEVQPQESVQQLQAQAQAVQAAQAAQAQAQAQAALAQAAQTTPVPATPTTTNSTPASV
jgi:hypothetical protein